MGVVFFIILIFDMRWMDGYFTFPHGEDVGYNTMLVLVLLIRLYYRAWPLACPFFVKFPSKRMLKYVWFFLKYWVVGSRDDDWVGNSHYRWN